MRKRDCIKVLLGKNIKYYRVKSGYTQIQFAEKIDCDFKYLGDVENGWFFPSSELLCKIIKVLDIPVSVLFTARD